MPDGAVGPAFLVYDNFRTIMNENKSIYFAAADRIFWRTAWVEADRAGCRQRYCGARIAVE